MIQTKTLNCPSCGAELLDPIYDLEMVDGGRRRLTCGECGRPFTVTASLVYERDGRRGAAGTPAADAVLAAFHLADGGHPARRKPRAAGPWGRAPRPV